MGDRELWAGAMAGMCKVTSVQQHLLRVVLGISNREQDPSTPELGLLLELHTQSLSRSASAVLSPEWCNSRLNKPTCIGDCKQEPLTPANVRNALCCCLPPLLPAPHLPKPLLVGKRKKGSHNLFLKSLSV